MDEIDHLLTHQSGLQGISGRSADMQTLLALEPSDPRARLAVDIFCYQVRKWIGAFAAALGGLDTLVFSGGIGEHAPVVRSADLRRAVLPGRASWLEAAECHRCRADFRGRRRESTSASSRPTRG